MDTRIKYYGIPIIKLEKPEPMYGFPGSYWRYKVLVETRLAAAELKVQTPVHSFERFETLRQAKAFVKGFFMPF